MAPRRRLKGVPSLLWPGTRESEGFAPPKPECSHISRLFVFISQSRLKFNKLSLKLGSDGGGKKQPREVPAGCCSKYSDICFTVVSGLFPFVRLMCVFSKCRRQGAARLVASPCLSGSHRGPV